MVDAYRPCIAWGGFILGLVVVGLAGCGGDQYDRSVVHGRVTYQGQAIPQGQIRLIAIEGTEAPAAGARIEDGEYRIDAKGGVPKGKYRVEFLMFQPKGQSIDMTGVVQQVMPEQFNKRSTITLTVPPGGETIEQNYELP
jgi:hypothetical protein